MNNVLSIFRREFKSYFSSPIAYGLLTVFLFISGYFYYMFLQLFNMMSIQMYQQAQMYRQAPPAMNVNLQMIEGMMNNLSVVTLFIVPLIAMRLVAEEKKQGTLELLMTSPLMSWQWILGKYLAAFALYIIMLLPPFILVISLNFFGNPENWPIITGFAGLVLIGGCLLAVGLLISCLTENQIIAAVVSFGASLFLYVINWISELGGTMGQIASAVSIMRYFEDFSKGVVDVSSVLFYFSFIFFGLYLTYRSIDSIRWRI